MTNINENNYIDLASQQIAILGEIAAILIKLLDFDFNK